MKKSLLFRFASIAFLILLFVFVSILIELTQLKRLSREYQLVDKELSIYGKLDKIKKMKGVAYVQINNRKLVFRPSANHNYRKEYLIDNLFVGDSIVKESGNDSIWVYRNQMVYTFVHVVVISSSDYIDN